MDATEAADLLLRLQATLPAMLTPIALSEMRQMGAKQLKTEVESELVKIYFDLQNIFRQSDCICRISTLGFWVLLTGMSKSDGELLLTRTSDLLPKYLDLAISYHNSGESQLDWYAQIDKLHFLK
jgi:hypothetical protein